MKEEISKKLAEAVADLHIAPESIKVDHPEDYALGDFTSNIAMVCARASGMSPKALAEKIAEAFRKGMPASVTAVEVAGPGFINFRVKGSVFAEAVLKIDEDFGRGGDGAGKQVLVEFTDPNTFKVFHIGHLMSNAIGESISRLIEYSGSNVVRICYPSDIGLHIAKSVWALNKHLAEMPLDSAPIAERTMFLGKMYVEGTNAYDSDPAIKGEIDALNKVLYEKTDPSIDALYEKGRKWSLDHFEELYRVLGTKFDDYIYESEMASVGLSIVRTHAGSGIFKESEGAIIFRGEDYGLHTRVFVNSNGIPTYEAKELGLNTTKFKKHPDADRSLIITASEQNDYFKVLIKTLSLIDEAIGGKTRHIGHGMMRFASGKMSSRTGNVVTAESLIADMREQVAKKIADRDFDARETEEISDTIAIGAIKYSILRAAIGGDIVFDSAASISFEGDSGPYLQYSTVRAASVLAKAAGSKVGKAKIDKIPETIGPLERSLTRFPDVAARARDGYAPQIVANYLVSLAAAFNSFYAAQIILDEKDPFSPYRVALTRAFHTVMTNGLWLLGIKVPEKM